MKIIKTLCAGVFCALLVTTTTFSAESTATATPSSAVVVETVKAPASDESWVFTLGGSGATTTDGNVGTAVGAELSLGRTGHLLLPLEAGLRQSFGYDGDSTALFTTKVYGDWTVLRVKSVDVFVGGNVGLTYGNTEPLWEIAPEAGVRVWLKEDVAIFGRAEVPFDMEEWVFKDTVRYGLGLQLLF
jgi:hypothetical protein